MLIKVDLRLVLSIREREGGQWDDYYTSLQSFIIVFS